MGLKDLPSNAAWVLSKALQPAKPAVDGIAETASGASDTVGAAAAKVRDTTSSLRDSMADRLPVLGGDSLESLMRQTDDASEEARLAEERAVALAEEAKAAGDEAKTVSNEARERAQVTEQESEREASARIDAARESQTRSSPAVGPILIEPPRRLLCDLNDLVIALTTCLRTEHIACSEDN